MAEQLYCTFASSMDAQRCAEALLNAGCRAEDLSLLLRDRAGSVEDRSYGQQSSSQARGAMKGAAAGAAVGALAGISSKALPGFGTVYGKGRMAQAAMQGAGIGAAAGGLAGFLKSQGIPERTASKYATSLDQGGALLALTAPSGKVDRAKAEQIFGQFGARETGAFARGMPQERRFSESGSTQEQKRIPIVEENLRVGKEQVQTGGVRVEKTIQETPVEKDVQLRQEHVTVERRPADRPATEADLLAGSQGSIEMFERSEKPVIEKEARVTEEVILGKDVDVTSQRVRDNVRKTDVDVDEVDREFRSSHEQRYGPTGERYDEHQPAYRYGERLARDERYAGREWNEAESEIRSDWESEQPGTWERFNESIRSAWDRMSR